MLDFESVIPSDDREVIANELWDSNRGRGVSLCIADAGGFSGKAKPGGVEHPDSATIKSPIAASTSRFSTFVQPLCGRREIGFRSIAALR